jgi:hypothetical protein
LRFKVLVEVAAEHIIVTGTLAVMVVLVVIAENLLMSHLLRKHL